jgi:HSP20 family protein
VTDNLLTVSGTKFQQKEEKTAKLHRFERDYGAFERTFTLPATVNGKGIKATYAEGLLTVTLPKVEAAKPQNVMIDVVPAHKA